MNCEGTNRNKRLNGKRAVVTGGAGGIGSAISLRFAEAGARVLIVDVDVPNGERVARELSDAGYEVRFAAADVTCGSDMATIAAELKQSWGSIDVLAHVAGISGRPLGDGPVTECSETTWKRVIDVNLTGAYLVCHHLVPLMYESGGSVIHIASDDHAGHSALPHDTHAYIAAKGGLIALTKAMAISYASRNIQPTRSLRAGFEHHDRRFDVCLVDPACADRPPSAGPPGSTRRHRLGSRVFGQRRIGLHHRRRAARGRRSDGLVATAPRYAAFSSLQRVTSV